MKKIIVLSLLLLISCNAIPNEMTGGSLPPIGKTFELSEKCPHLCWMGINPGTTTMEQAKLIISESNQINKQYTQVSEDHISIVWNIGKLKSYSSNVGIQLENGLVKSIDIGVGYYTINDFIKFLGKPDEICATKITAADAIYYTYSVYYISSKIEIDVGIGSQKGPYPSDIADVIWLNSEFYPASHPEWGITQPWLGYGHLNDYLPGVEILPTYVMPTP